MKRVLEGIFKISVSGSDDWKKFDIPGSAMQSFVVSGDIPNPYIGVNEYKVRDFLDNDFVVRGVFVVEDDVLKKKKKELILKSIDTVCDVYLNGQKIRHCENAHIKYRIDVSDILKAQNELEFRFSSATRLVNSVKPGADREITMINTGTMANSQYIRKSHSSFGWDWGPQLPDCGIYEPMEIIAYDEVRLDDVWVRQDHNLGEGVVGLKVFSQGIGIVEADIKTEVFDPAGDKIYEGEFFREIEIYNPEYWWPAGYGDQPLYTVKVTATSRTTGESDELSTRVGLRTLTVSRNKDEWGKEFAFTVNGHKIFAMGADYIPDNCFYGLIDDETLERDIRAAKFANFNCLRVWGGGFYPRDKFYDLCDEAGIILWQDFMFACNVYDLESSLEGGEKFRDLIKAEIRYVTKRIRNHACLGLLCGNNEMEVAWLEWEITKHHSDTLRKDYLEQFEELIPDLCKRYAPDTFYVPSSPSKGGGFDDPDNENDGDSHYWKVWHGMKPFRDYENHYFRFLSEFGFQSFPSMKTIAEFIEKEDDLRIDSEIMESHQKNPSANEKILAYLKECFKEPANFEELVLDSQIMQGIAMKTAVDHMRRNRGRCMGSLYWQFNDDWPVASWSSIDYYGRYKALHYMARKFYAPIAPSIVIKDKKVEFWVSNESPQRITTLCSFRLKTMDFKTEFEERQEIFVPRFAAVKVFEHDFTELFENNSELNLDNVFVEMSFNDYNEWATFVPIKDLKIETPILKVEFEKGQKTTWISSPTFVPYVFLEGREEDIIFKDNFFAITSAEPVVAGELE